MNGEVDGYQGRCGTNRDPGRELMTPNGIKVVDWSPNGVINGG